MSILNTVWYTSFPPIDSDSFSFKALVSWISMQLHTSYPKLIQEPYANSTLMAPAQLLFVKDDGSKSQLVDAVLTYENPDVSLVLLQEVFGLPVTNVHYVAPTLPVVSAPAPPPPSRLVGPAIEGKPGWFYTVPGDNSPDGTEFAQDGHVYLKQVIASVVGSSAFWFQVG